MLRTIRPRHALMAALLLATASGCTSFRTYLGNGFKVGPNYHGAESCPAPHWIDATDGRCARTRLTPAVGGPFFTIPRLIVWSSAPVARTCPCARPVSGS